MQDIKFSQKINRGIIVTGTNTLNTVSDERIFGDCIGEGCSSGEQASSHMVI